MDMKKILDSVLCPHTYDKSQRLIKEKVITVNIVMLLMGAVLLSFAILRFFESNYIQSAVDAMMFFVICLSYFLLYKNMYRIIFVSRLLIFFATITALTLIIFSPDVATRFAWISICTYMMFFLLDLKEGVVWFITMSFIIIALFIADLIQITLSEFMIFFISTTVLALLLSRYEKIKEESEHYFTIHAQELQKAVEEKTNELRAQKEMFETLFKKSFDGILLIENKQFVECNDAIVKMLGYQKREDLLNTHPSELSPKYQADGQLSSEKAEEMMNICLEKGSNNFEWIHQKANGINFWCDVTLTHLVFHNKDIIHTVWRDISEKKALELENKKINKNLEKEVKKRTYELEIAMRTKSDFLANMSHEIRTPLNAILGFIDILKKDEYDIKRKEYLDIIHTSGEGLLTIINDILDFSKIESGKLELEMKPFETIRPFEDVQLLFFEKAKEKHLVCNLNVLSELPSMLIGDTVRIKQIVSNIVSNAIKFTPEGGSISINLSYDHDNSMLHCSIVDSGIGISEENAKNIFKSFAQADTTTTRNFGGTGLGLSISKLLVELMGGEIDLESEMGKGSEFSFNIFLEPYHATAEKQLLESEPIEQQMALHGKVLIVEDNKTNQMLLQIMLEELGLQSDVVNNGLEAVEKVKTNTYELILMDENMPVMNGMEATKRIKDLGIDTPIVAVTANALKGDKEKFLEAGMDDYISKPIDNTKFINILKKYLS